MPPPGPDHPPHQSGAPTGAPTPAPAADGGRRTRGRPRVEREEPPARRHSAVWAPEYRQLIALLRKARLRRGLTQAAAAAALGQPASWVNKIELGERRLDPIDLWRLAALYGEPVTSFFPPDPPTFAR